MINTTHLLDGSTYGVPMVEILAIGLGKNSGNYNIKSETNTVRLCPVPLQKSFFIFLET
jgi:hypothetical protein